MGHFLSYHKLQPRRIGGIFGRVLVFQENRELFAIVHSTNLHRFDCDFLNPILPVNLRGELKLGGLDRTPCRGHGIIFREGTLSEIETYGDTPLLCFSGICPRGAEPSLVAKEEEAR